MSPHLRRIVRLSAVFFALRTGLLCLGPLASAAPQSAWPGSTSFDVLTFDSSPGGTIADLQFGRFGTGPVLVTGSNPDLPGENAAVIFDSAAPTPADLDLGAPHVDFGGPGVGAGGAQGSPFENSVARRGVLIVAQDLTDSDGDGLVDAPNDSSNPNTALFFDFTELGGVRPVSIGAFDIEPRPQPAIVRMYGEDGALLEELVLTVVGDNGFAQVGLGQVEDVFLLEVDLGGSGAVDNLVFAPDLSGSVEGFVWRDLDGDGLQEEDEPGLEGVVLDLFVDGFSDSGSLLSVVTGTDGSYLFPEVPAGSYSLVVDPATLPEGILPTECNDEPGAGLDSECSPFPLTLIPGQVASARFGFTFTTDLAIGDFCFLDKDRDGIQDPEDPGVEGVVLTLFDSEGNLVDTQVTAEDGAYLFSNLSPGEYMIVPDSQNASVGGGFGLGLGSALCQVGDDGAVDSDCGPVCVTLVNQLLGEPASDVTIDFGYALCGPCLGTVDALSFYYDSDGPAFVELIQLGGPIVFAETLQPGDVFTVFGPNGGDLAPAILVLVDGQSVGELDATCTEALFVGLRAGPLTVVAGRSTGGGALCTVGAYSLLDFNDLVAGEQLSLVSGSDGFGPISIEGINPDLPGQNAALAFDSGAPTGGDADLGSPNQDFGGPGVGDGGGAGSPFANVLPRGGILIVGDDLVDSDGDGLVDDPGDTGNPDAALIVDFLELGPVVMDSISVLDLDSLPPSAAIRMLSVNGSLLGEAALPFTGDNGYARIDLGRVEGVQRLEIDLGGSGAIDDILFAKVGPARLGGFVWNDQSQDGFRDLGEPGLQGVDLLVYKAGQLVSTVTTGAGGAYFVDDLVPGLYRLEVDSSTLPAGAVPTLCNQLPGDTYDSECSPTQLRLLPGITSSASFGYQL